MPAPTSRTCPHCGALLATGAPRCATCGRPLESEPDPHTGKVLLGKYRCLERIGSGRTSQVYKAQHVRLSSLRAIKILRAELKGDARATEAFWREAHVASLLRSRNAALLHDADTLPDATPCSVWEYVDGPLLADRVGEGALGPDAAVVIRGLLNALAELHDKGWAHLDLCPHNVVLGRAEHALEPHLIDFGEARTLGSPGGRAVEDLRPGYSAPEQVLGSGPLDARADVFAMGAIACYAYTGLPPLASPNLEAYADWLRRFDPKSLRSLAPLPAPLRQVVERCLDPDPERRPADAGALREEIRRLGHDSSGDLGGLGGEVLATAAVGATRRATRAAARTDRYPSAEPAPASGALPDDLVAQDVSAELLVDNVTNTMGRNGVPLRPVAAPATPRAELVPIAGTPSKHPLPVGALTSIGRSAGNTALIDHPTVSKNHGQLRWDGTDFVYEDLGSRNGSSVAGKRVTGPTPIKDGDKLIVGEVVLRFRLVQS